VAMQFYASPEQIMRDRSEFARKNIARGRNVVVLTYEGGVLFVAENLSTALHKVSEIYDRIGFAAVGRYNEFENMRVAGIRLADLRGYSYDRRDVTGRVLANAYTQILGTIFMDQTKPYEVELCIAEVGNSPDRDELYRITYDGSVFDESGVVAMGGQAEAIVGVLRDGHRDDMTIEQALGLAVRALASVGGEGGAPRSLTAAQLEVAVLDRRRTGRTFRRINGNALAALLESAQAAPAEQASTDEASAGEGEQASTAEASAGEGGQASTAEEAQSASAEGSETAPPVESESGEDAGEGESGAPEAG
jgi:proteasome alpha subunit